MVNKHKHWEINSECPKCGAQNHIIIPVGEQIVDIICSKKECRKEYVHIVREHVTVEDGGSITLD